jgi:aminopeptidase N
VFIVADFLSVSTLIQTNGVGAPFILSVYSTPHQVSKLDFALQTGKGVTEFYLNYFQIPYPLPKLGKHMYYNWWHSMELLQNNKWVLHRCTQDYSNIY